jgi:ABC-type phosphate transport system permease subunit
MAESSGVHRSALFAMALVLLLLAMLLILIIRFICRERKLAA